MGTASVKLETPKSTILVDPFVQLPGGEHPNRIEDFLGAGYIIITHGHLDHLASTPSLLRRSSFQVYCTDCAARILEKDAALPDTIHRIKPGDTFSVGDVDVIVYSGRHIKFDVPLVLRTLSPFHLVKNQRNVLPLIQMNHRFQENDETVFYELHTHDLRIQIMGSLALRDGVAYPTGADLLFLPYQGRSKLVDTAERILGRLRPKRILATHFDNAFPPLSQTIPTSDLVQMVHNRFPDCEITIPEYGITEWI